MERWLERLGYAAQWMSDTVAEAVERSRDAATELGSQAAEHLDLEGDSPMEEPIPGMLASAAGAWAASRLLSPDRVQWSRAILAGVIGTLLYDAEMAIDQRLLGRKFDTIRPLGEAFSDDPEVQRWAGWASHYAAGVVLAVFYARYLHRRLPGPPVARGAVFGLLDAATLAWGGLLPLAGRVAPQIDLPRGFSGLASAPRLTPQVALRHLAYGAGVGLVYRPRSLPRPSGG